MHHECEVQYSADTVSLPLAQRWYYVATRCSPCTGDFSTPQDIHPGPTITPKSEMNMSFPLPNGPHNIGRDLLQQLPIELLLDILKKCPDFTSLWSMVNTSPRLSSLFDNNALEIVEAVLDSAVPTPIRSLMRAVIHIRTRSFECQTWEEERNFSLATRSSQALGPATSPAVLRKFVGLAHKIHVLAHLCINRCFQRCMLILMKPVLYENPFSSHPSEGGDQLRNGGCQDLGPPVLD